MDQVISILIVLVVLAVVIGLWYISTMNSLRRLEVKINEADSGIDVALTKRYDVLTKLVNTTKGYEIGRASCRERV